MKYALIKQIENICEYIGFKVEIYLSIFYIIDNNTRLFNQIIVLNTLFELAEKDIDWRLINLVKQYNRGFFNKSRI